MSRCLAAQRRFSIGERHIGGRRDTRLRRPKKYRRRLALVSFASLATRDQQAFAWPNKQKKGAAVCSYIPPKVATRARARVAAAANKRLTHLKNANFSGSRLKLPRVERFERPKRRVRGWPREREVPKRLAAELIAERRARGEQLVCTTVAGVVFARRLRLRGAGWPRSFK